MGEVALVAFVGLTSLAGYWLGRRHWGLPGRNLREASRAALETIGLGVVFYAANLALAAVALGLARVLAREFVSAYGIDDVALLGASLLQGLVFRWWWGRR